MFAKARWDSSFSHVSQYDITVWVLGHHIIAYDRAGHYVGSD